MSNTPEKPGNRHPEKDRRLCARQRIHSLSYVRIGDSNGGIVLNLSEGGISVQAAGILDESEPVTMWLEVPGVRDRIEVTGEVVWLSGSRKEAGLRFVDLPESALQEIRKWIAREASPEKFEGETDPAHDEQSVLRQAKQRDRAQLLEPMEADSAVAEEIEDSGSQPESIEHLATAQDEEHVVEASEKQGIPEETEVDEEPETETAPEVETAPVNEAVPASKDESETEDELINAFGPPVVPFERRPHAPFSSMSAISGASRGAQSLAIAPALERATPTPFADQATQPKGAPGSDWKDFRVQLQTGWFLAALVLLLALISFIAGMAVRRGALNGVMGDQDDSSAPKSAPAANPALPGSTGDSASESATVAPASPLSIEIVDTANHSWVISANAGANRTSAAEVPEKQVNTSGSIDPNLGANHPTTPGIRPQPQNSGQPAATESSAGGPAAEKPIRPLVLSLPETPISASGSVAISSQRSVPMPVDDAQSAKNGRNLQVGQLVNLVEPVYPAEAVQQRIEGTVKLHAVIGTDGVLESLAQVSGPQILVNASMAAVRNWKYSPTRMNGQAIETQEDISFVFRLPN